MNTSVASVPSVPSRVVQKTFNLDLTTTRPLCTVNTAMTILRVREDDVKEMWERGDLQFAFNIASAGAHKTEPRIALQSVANYQAGYRAPIGFDPVRATDNRELAALLESLWLHSRASLRLSEIYDAFCCSSQHALTLWREGHFGPTPEIGRSQQSPLTSGSQRTSPIVPRPLVINFLKSRRLP